MIQSVQLFPIGVLHTQSDEKYACPRQPMAHIGPSEGLIELREKMNLEQALEDLMGFSHIWILGLFHRTKNWKPKIQPPRGNQKVGCLASRSPHRPNPISLSLVSLVAVEGRRLWIGNHDLLNGTPILDIKPYLEAVDCLEGTRSGWTEHLPDLRYTLATSTLAREQLDWLEQQGVPLMTWVEPTLSLKPEPGPNNRVTPLPGEGTKAFRLAVKSWRVDFTVQPDLVRIESIQSGYPSGSLTSQKEASKGNDLSLHSRFNKRFRD